MAVSTFDPDDLPSQTAEFYRRILRALSETDAPFLVGGAYAYAVYTGIVRHTKDMDMFVCPADVDDVMAALDEAGCRTSITYPHWLAKAEMGDASIDIIYRSGNGVSEVDESWHAHARTHEVLGVPAPLCPPEEILWTKAFVMERKRFDGADVSHLLLSCGEDMDWERLLERFGPDWRVLLSHLILFGFIYPSRRSVIPSDVMSNLLQRLESEGESSEEPWCGGTLLSRAQYLVDVNERGFKDARLQSNRYMSQEQVDNWTDAISDDVDDAE